jgi:hypothetical protein
MRARLSNRAPAGAGHRPQSRRSARAARSGLTIGTPAGTPSRRLRTASPIAARRSAAWDWRSRSLIAAAQRPDSVACSPTEPEPIAWTAGATLGRAWCEQPALDALLECDASHTSSAFSAPPRSFVLSFHGHISRAFTLFGWRLEAVTRGPGSSGALWRRTYSTRAPRRSSSHPRCRRAPAPTHRGNRGRCSDCIASAELDHDSQ